MRPTTCKENSKWLTYKEPSTTLMPPIQTHGRPLEAQMVTGCIFIGCWWFWSLIYWKTTCISSYRIYHKILPWIYWLYQLHVLCHQTILEILLSKKRWHIYAKLYPNAICEFQYPYPKRSHHAHTNGNAQTMY